VCGFGGLGVVGGLAYAGLGTSSAESVDPDVLGDDVALLVEVCVLLELQRREGQHLVFARGFLGCLTHDLVAREKLDGLLKDRN
jgi:hypothetical protein